MANSSSNSQDVIRMTDSEDLETLEPGPAIPPPTIPRPQQPPQQQQPNGVTRPLPTIGFQPPFSMPSAPMNGWRWNGWTWFQGLQVF